MPLRLRTFDQYKKKSSLFFLVSSVSLIILLIFLYTTVQPTQIGKKSAEVKIGDNSITVEIADSPEKRSQGLSGRSSLPNNQGMLFVFNEAGKYPFWMKDMKFPIDIIWINDGGVVAITSHANPEIYNDSSLTTYKPKEPARYVLEVNANYTLENNIKVGDGVEISGLN